jgi:hypothetical protein
VVIIYFSLQWAAFFGLPLVFCFVAGGLWVLADGFFALRAGGWFWLFV